MTQRANARTVGVLLNYWVGYSREVMLGFERVMRKENINVLTFVGCELVPSGFQHHHAMANNVFDLVDQTKFAGLALFPSQFGKFLPDLALEEFVSRFSNIPRVSIAREISGIPTIKSDNRAGMQALMDHLIVERQFKRFVFIRGSILDPDSQIREQVFLENLSKQGLEIPNERILSCEYSMPIAYEAVQKLLQTRHDFDVIVAANDLMAYGAMKALNQAGLNVPIDVAVVGFDDFAESAFTIPPLTTVKQPMFEMGEQAALLLLKQINYMEVDQEVMLPTTKMVRKSCGTDPQWNATFESGADELPSNTDHIGFLALFDQLPNNTARLSSDWALNLYLNLHAAIFDLSLVPRFLMYWKDQIHEFSALNNQWDWWQNLLNALHGYFLKQKLAPENLKRLSLLIAYAHTTIASEIQLIWTNERVNQTAIFHEINATEAKMMSCNKMSDLTQLLEEYLCLAGLERFFLVIYQNQGVTPDTTSQVLLAYDHRKSFKLDKTPFSSNQLLPSSMQSNLTGHLVVLPLFSNNKHLGFIVLEPPEKLQNGLEEIRQSVGRALSNVKQIETLEESYEGAIRAMGIALEARDRETAGHTDRVTQMAVLMGQTIGLSPEQLQHLRWGSYLHDIGKLVMPDSILRKPGPLTPEERSKMQEHTIDGEKFALRLPFLPEGVRQVIRHHHEHWNGNGYPDGLIGENINIKARIFAICDVYDALTSKRVYKPAFSVEHATQELLICAESGHLDPNLVPVFIGLIPKFNFLFA